MEGWSAPPREFHRVLRPGTEDYFATELWQDTWTMGGRKVPISFYRRPLSAMLDPCLDAGFSIERVAEPPPAAELRTLSPEDHHRLSTHPAFLFLVLRRPAA